MLDKFLQLKNKIIILEEEIEILESRITTMSKELKVDIVQQSRRHDNLENGIIKLIQMKEEYEKTVEKYLSEREKIIEEFLAMPNGYILYLRYVKGLKIYEIAETMHYSYRWTQKLLKQAIEDYERRHVSSC